jgi:hypothetical protein
MRVLTGEANQMDINSHLIFRSGHGNWYHLGTFADFSEVNLIQLHPGEPEDIAYGLVAYIPSFPQGSWECRYRNMELRAFKKWAFLGQTCRYLRGEIMGTRRVETNRLSLAAVYVLIALLCTAQQALGQTCEPIPVGSDDGLSKSPQNYSLLYEDNDVRVLEATIPPRSSQVMHAFTRPAVLYNPVSVRSKTYSPGVDDPIEHEEDKDYHPVATRIPPVGLYRTQNLSNRLFSGLRVELKHPGCGLRTDSLALPSGVSSAETEAASGHFRILYEDSEIRVADVWIEPGNGLSLSDTTGFYYFPQGKPQSLQDAKATSESKSQNLVPIDSLQRALEKNVELKKPVHAVLFQLKYKAGT